MDIGETIKSPWVIGGGVVLGLILLTMRSGAGGSAVATPGANSNALLAYQTNVGQQQSAEHIAMAQITAGDINSFRGALISMIGAENDYNTKMAQINAGTVNAALTAHTALAMDVNDNANRIELTRINTQANVDLAGINGHTAVTVAQTNANAGITIAQTQARANVFGSLIGTIGGIVKAIL